MYVYIYIYIVYLRECNYHRNIVHADCIDMDILKRTHTHTLDKNGSLYDPAGTES